MKKSLADLTRAWQRKAASDLAAAEVCLKAACSLDAACFHCQQAAEKSLKAFLISRDEDYPHTHDLRRLIALCAKKSNRNSNRWKSRLGGSIPTPLISVTSRTSGRTPYS